MQKKKGIQLSQAFGAVLTLVLVAVLVIIAIVIYVSLATSFAGTSSATVTNESGANITDGYTVLSTSNCSFGEMSVTEINNGTEIIDAGNYTFTAAGVITNTTGPSEIGQNLLNVSYTYTWGSEACTASENMTVEFGNYTSLIGLVGTIIFLGLVIGILVAAFAFGGRRET